jgi:hypothetical protein
MTTSEYDLLWGMFRTLSHLSFGQCSQRCAPNAALHIRDEHPFSASSEEEDDRNQLDRQHVVIRFVLWTNTEMIWTREV